MASTCTTLLPDDSPSFIDTSYGPGNLGLLSLTSATVMVTRTSSVSGGVAQSLTVIKNTYCAFFSRSSSDVVDRFPLPCTVNFSAAPGGILYCKAQLVSVSGSLAEILPNEVFGDTSKMKSENEPKPRVNQETLFRKHLVSLFVHRGKFKLYLLRRCKRNLQHS